MKRTLSRMISVVLTLAMVISMLALPASAITWDNVSDTHYASRYQTSDYKTGKFYKNMTQIPLTGDGRRDVVAVAASQVGYIEGDNANGYDGETGGSTNYTEYGYFLGLTGGSGHAWCAAFCAWTFYTAEVTDTDGYYYDTNSGNIWADTYVPDWSNYLIDQGRYKAAYQFRNSYSSLYDASYVPQPGDLVFFYTASGDYPGWEGHIGLVAYSDGTYVYTLEGNTSSQDGVESEGGGMFFKKYSLTGSNLVGFGSMPYESVAGLPTIDYTGNNPTPGLYVTTSGAKSVYQNINDSTASWTLPMSSVFEVTEIATASDGTVMLYSKCEINGSTVYGWIPHGSDSNGYTKTLQIYASTELEIPESYGPSQDAQGNYKFENAYGYTFKIDDVNGTIGGEDATLITTASAYENCNPNWAVSVQLRPNGNANEYSVVKVVATPGSAANAGITLASGDKILVVHSADSKPGYANWMSKVAAMALKEGDVLSINSSNTSATVLRAGEAIDPPATEPTEPTPTEPIVTPDIPDYGGLIPGAGVPGTLANPAPNFAMGCDLSFYNVNDTDYRDYITNDDSGADYSLTDFAAMKASGCDFVILRMGASDSNGYYYDPHFVTMYNMAREVGMDVGVYFYSYAMSEAEAIAEAEYVIDVIEDHGMYFEYPIYIDIEEADQIALGTTAVSAIAKAWCETMYDNGYFPGIYGAYNLFNVLSTEIQEGYDLWLAWISYSDGSVPTPETDNISDDAGVWQFTFTGQDRFDGIGLDMLDVNVSYKDYAAIMAAYGYNNVEKASEPTEPTEPEPTEPEPTEPEPTEPKPTEPKPTEPVDVPNYGGAIPGAGQQGYTGNLYYGIDISYHNVDDQSYHNYITDDDSGADYSLLDFDALKASGCDYVIIRLGSQDTVNGKFIDPHFKTMYNLAREAGMDIGLYFYSYAMTYDEAVADAEFCLDYLNQYDFSFEYPIYIDIEEADQLALDEAGLSAIAYGWCDTMVDAGYFPGIYTGYYASQTMSTQLKNDYDMWIASYGTGVTPENDNLSDMCAMWQYSSTGHGEYDGIGLEFMDVNVCYKDYPAIMTAGGYNKIGQTSEPDPSEPTQPSEPETEPTQPSEPEVTEPTPTEPAIDIPNYGGAIPGAGIPGATTLAPNLYYGCDVSFYNVNDQSYANYTTSDDSGADYSLLDFERMKADGCDFVILRMGSSDSSGYYYDPHFVTLYNMARAAGMDIGLYFYSYAMNKNEAIAEANYVIDVIEDLGMYFEYPIYIDIEESDQLSLGQTTLDSICYGWCDTLYAAGYYPGVYGNYNLYDAVGSQVKNDYDFWVAWVSSATSQSAYNPSTHNISNEASMWQYSFYGYEYDGVGMDMLDVNVSYKDYPAIMKAYGYNNIPQETKIPDSYGPSVDGNGNYTFENAYGYVFNIDDVNGEINGEDATLITSASAYTSCNPNWAISVQLRPTGETNEYQVVKVVAMPGSAANAGITLEDGDVILVVHSAESKPGQYANWMSKVAALALKEGDIIEIASNNKTATVIGPGEIEEPIEPSEPTEPSEPETEPTEPSKPETEPTEPEAIQITQQPTDFVGLVGDTATFTVAAEGEGLSYQWYYYDTSASEWLKAGNGTAATLNVEFKAYRNNQQYRCEITDAQGNTVVTEAVKITAQAMDLVITSQPVSYTGSVNDDLTFAVEATGNGLTYQWYYSNDNGAYWSKSGSPGFDTDTVALILRAYRDGNQYKCVITDIFGNTVTTDVVTMTIKTSEITITQQPASVENAVLGQLYQFSVAAEGENLTYRWEISTDGGATWAESWNDGYDTATLYVRMYANRDGNQYRCVVTSGQKTVLVSDAAGLDLQDASVQIVSSPENVYTVAGNTATFTVEATGLDLTYTWYRSDDGGNTWVKTYLDGYDTDTLSFTANANRAAMFKCLVIDGSGKEAMSGYAKLQIVSAELQLLTQPESVTCAAGETAVLTVEAQGDGLKYQWYASADGGETWVKSYMTGYDTAEYAFVVNATRAAKLYKCVITDVGGNTVETNAVSITIG